MTGVARANNDRWVAAGRLTEAMERFAEAKAEAEAEAEAAAAVRKVVARENDAIWLNFLEAEGSAATSAATLERVSPPQLTSFDHMITSPYRKKGTLAFLIAVLLA